MRFQEINERDKIYNQAISLYERNFIELERRDNEEQARVMKDKDYHFEVILLGEELCGIVFYWETDDFIYLEHLCVMENQRGKGVGAFALNYLKEKNKRVILEIEPVVDQVTNKRLTFYENNGFLLNDYYHIQPKLHKGDKDLRLLILTDNAQITQREYDNFYKYLMDKVQAKQ